MSSTLPMKSSLKNSLGQRNASPARYNAQMSNLSELAMSNGSMGPRGRMMGG